MYNHCCIKGMVFYQKGKYDEALTLFDKILNQPGAENNVQSLLYKGMVLLKNGDYKNATIVLLKAEESNMSNYFIKNELGIAYRYSNEYEKAIVYFEEALKFKPGNVQSFDGLFKCYRSLLKYKNAVEVVDKMCKESIFDVKLLKEAIGLCLYNEYGVQDYDKAQSYLNLLQQLKFQDKESYINKITSKIFSFRNSFYKKI
ncbi:MAG: tetratricopeptide repeat protein [Spirosomataceae bacterium]